MDLNKRENWWMSIITYACLDLVSEWKFLWIILLFLKENAMDRLKTYSFYNFDYTIKRYYLSNILTSIDYYKDYNNNKKIEYNRM